MTLIATAISRYGIVLAADRRFTTHPEQQAAGPRIFRVDCINAALSVTGGEAWAGLPLDAWMASAIADYENAGGPQSLAGFVDVLRDRLTAMSDPIQRRAIHVAGYVADGKRSHPEVYYVRNVRRRAADGGYGAPGREFIVSEEFWSRDYPIEETRETLSGGGARMYLDGFAQKRVAYMLLHEQSHEFYGRLWQNGSKMFRTPRTLEDIASLVVLDMQICATFLLSQDSSRRRSNNQLEIEAVPAPANAITF